MSSNRAERNPLELPLLPPVKEQEAEELDHEAAESELELSRQLRLTDSQMDTGETSRW